MVQRARRFALNLVASLFDSGVFTAETADLLVRTITRITTDQTVAATLTVNTIARAAGKIVEVRAMRAGAAAGAGESMSIAVTSAGAAAITPIVIDNTTAADKFVKGTLTIANVDFAAGDLIAITRTYVAGGTPTPMTNTKIEVDVRYDLA